MSQMNFTFTKWQLKVKVRTLSNLIIVRVLEFEDVLVSSLRIAVDQVEVVWNLGIEIGHVFPFAAHRISTTSNKAQVPKSAKSENIEYTLNTNFNSPSKKALLENHLKSVPLTTVDLKCLYNTFTKFLDKI